LAHLVFKSRLKNSSFPRLSLLFLLTNTLPAPAPLKLRFYCAIQIRLLLLLSFIKKTVVRHFFCWVSHKIFLVRLFCVPRLLRAGATVTSLPPVTYAIGTVGTGGRSLIVYDTIGYEMQF